MTKDTVGKYGPEVLKAPLKEAELLHDTGKAAAETAAAYALVRKYGLEKATEYYQFYKDQGLSEPLFRAEQYPICLTAAKGDEKKAEELYQSLLLLYKGEEVNK